MTKIKSKRLLGVLLSAALLASMMLPSGVTAAEVGEAVGVTPAAATEATATDTAAEEVTTIAEVSETAATVDAAAAEEAEVVEEDEEVTVIDEVSETAETVEADSSTVIETFDSYSTSTFASTYVGGTKIYKTMPSSYSFVDKITNQSLCVTYSGSSETVTYGYAQNGYSIGTHDTLEFDVVSDTAFTLTLQICGRYNGIYWWYASGATSSSNCNNATNKGIYETTIDVQASDSTQHFSVSLSSFINSADSSNLEDNRSLMDAVVSGNKTKAASLWLVANPTVSTTATVYYDNIAFTGDSSITVSYDYDSTSEARSENNVVVVQDFETQVSTDIADNWSAISYATDSAYLDGTSAVVTRSGGDQARLQTSAVTLAGEGLYFEIESAAENPFIVSKSGDGVFYLHNTTEASAQNDTVNDENYNLIAKISISGAKYTVKTVSNDGDTYTYAIMISWEELGLSGDTTTYNGISLRFYDSSWSSGSSIAFDNIGFYGVDVNLGTSDSSATSVDTDTIYGYGKSTMYAKVAASDISKYSNDVYPTTTLTYGTNNYIFAGWYTDGIGSTAYTEMPSTSSYAKFVDAAVMTMGFQVETNASTADDTVMIRLVTTVDSLYYENVGFTLKIGDWTCDFTTNNVYGTITGDAAGTYLPTDFSDASQYFVTATVTGITKANYDAELTVTVYWKTLDGTTVTSTLDKSLSGLAITGTGTSVSAIFDKATGNAE